MQKDLTQLLDYNTILVGHSLECDLKVLKVNLTRRKSETLYKLFANPTSLASIRFVRTQLIHSHVIDTSVIYQHPRGPPFKASLKWLAQKWLKKEIQTKTGEEGGHDSEEDARTAIELVKLKMDKGESSACPLSLSAPGSHPSECGLHARRSWVRRICQRSRNDL